MPHREYRAEFFRLKSNALRDLRLFRFRTKFFVHELGWSLPLEDGLERDQFDTATADYCALIRADGELCGCFRAIRCDHPYLAQVVFPHLAERRGYPADHRHIEISRFGVADRSAGAVLYSLMLRYAVDRRAKALVAITELSHERLLNRIGLKTMRYGNTHIVGFKDDGSWILGVSGEIPIPAPLPRDFQTLLQITDKMDISDETLVLGRQPVSA